jgi:hypothetical protein
LTYWKVNSINSEEAYEYAWEHADRNEDGSRVESSIVELLADRLPFDVRKARLGRAQRVLARRRRPGQTAPAGAVVFPGMEHYAFEPHRIIADDGGNLIHNEDATSPFKDAESGRALADLTAAAVRANRERREAEHFTRWVNAQQLAGRHPRELTWGACVRETGLWKEADPDPPEPDHG